MHREYLRIDLLIVDDIDMLPDHERLIDHRPEDITV